MMPNRENPILSIIVVIFNMKREAPRTLFTLTPNYQNIPPELYEVLVIDNGSTSPLGHDMVRSISEHFNYLYLEPSHPSPAMALNEGARRAKGQVLGFMIDGARMLSPGVLQYAIRASRGYRNPVISTLGFHLGLKPQQVSVSEGYNQEVEDQLLGSVDWRHNGYELFQIASFAGSSHFGWLAPIAESNCVFVTPETFNAIGGFEEAFDLPGGGIVNLDFYRRACELPQTELVVLLGEGSFHQFHNGATTGKNTQELEESLPALFEQYRQIRGKRYESPLVRCDYLGHAPRSVHRSWLDSFDLLDQYRRCYPGQARIFEEGAISPNPLNTDTHEQKTLVILGMHRSGTSMLAGSLQEAGLELGDVITKAPHNQKGNRENGAIMFMHEDLLACNGGSWDHPPETVRWEQLHKAVRDLFISGFNETAMWGFKDPRTLLTLDGWLEVLPGVQFVGIFRHPSLVALSLNRRNKLPFEQGLRLWEVYNQRLLCLHQEQPFPLIEFHGDAVHLREKLQQLIKVLDLPFKHRTLTFLEDHFRQASPIEIVVPPDILQLYNTLRDRMI